MQDLYIDFAERYDIPYGQPDQPDAQMMDFFRRLFGKYNVRRVLDCACGTGRHLLWLGKLGFELHGSDLSPSMLAQARQNLAAREMEIHLRNIDFRHLPEYYQERFDAVLCLGAIGYMPDEAQFLKAVESMAGVLREDGILVITALPTDRQWKEKPRFMLAADTPDCSRIFAIDYFEKTVRYNILDLLRNSQGAELKSWSAELTVFLRDDQEKLLKAGGFRRVEFFGSYEGAPYDKEISNQMITVAQK
jgi:SAM-dependent methyltransferase